MGKDFFLTTGLLAGTIIGAGIFSLPYVFSQIGFGAGLFYLIFFTLVYFVIHLMYAKIIESKDGAHQFFYFAKNYLPKKIANTASFIILFELILVLTVYLILAPTFAELIFGQGGLTALLIFWFLGSLFMFVKLEWLGWAEFLGTLCILAIVISVIFLGKAPALGAPIFRKIDWPLFFLPFGPLLFSLAGRPAIAKVVEECRKIKSSGRSITLNKIILWGTFIPPIVYLLFVVGILRLNPNVSPEALSGLGFLPPLALGFLGFLGLLTLWTSYFIIGINIKDILRIDLKRSTRFSVFVVLIAPLVLYFVGFKNFLSVVSLTGSVFLVLEGIFVIAMWRKAFPKNNWRWISWPLYFIFVVALGYEIVNFILPS